ncbi:hypothetical protein PH4a_13390 [Proteus hauseri]|nr:hypothetical protein PH4a_13390 [Proteus hauseri]
MLKIGLATQARTQRNFTQSFFPHDARASRNRELKKKIARLEKHNEILKKATALVMLGKR